jgi:hypothetical protein
LYGLIECKKLNENKNENETVISKCPSRAVCVKSGTLEGLSNRSLEMGTVKFSQRIFNRHFTRLYLTYKI